MPFDDQIRAALDTTAASLREHLEAELRAFSREAARLAGEDRQQAVQAADIAAAEVRAQAESQVAQIRAAAQKHAEEVKRAAEAQMGELRKALEELRTEAQQQLDAARRTVQAEIDKARVEVARVHTDVAKAHADVEKAHTEAEKARAEVERARADAEKARGDAENAHAVAERAHAEVERAHVEIEEAQVEIQNARTDAAHARSEAESARADADAARAETEAARQNATQEIAKVEAAHAVSERHIADAIERANIDSYEAELSRSARLVNAIRSLDEARGLSEVLERLLQRAGDEVDRAAVLLVKGDRLTGWRLTGFAPDAPPPNSIDLSVEDAGLAGAAYRTGVSASRPSDAVDAPRLPPFASNSGEHHAMALPVRVGGEVVAVLYADAPGHQPASDPRWPAVLEVLARHASRVLEALTVQKAAGLSMPRAVAHRSHAGSAQ